ncbi:MAG: MarR family transcriptional regulator [Myxococcales bacterium]|nr:MAG: MarR family transcriptional regulator [Myxococcales bacterium]
MTDPTALLDKVLHLSTLVNADLARFEQESGLTTARIHLLWVLGMTGPATQQSLAAALEVTPRNVTGLVNGLVDSGHVTREAHPSDRRATLVTPTAKGRKAIRQLAKDHGELGVQLFGDVPERRLKAFETTLDETIARFAALMEEAAQ